MKNKELIKLAKLFSKNGATLYVVGGFVRDEVNGDHNDDIDITSCLSPIEIKEFCGRKFKITDVSKKLGTILIEGKNLRAEYTPFRSEKYDSKFAHSPSEINFEKDLAKDAYRRDFTINAMYKNILTGEVIDIYSGKNDVKKKLIKQIHAQVFDVDPLRILRMVRFASVLNFEIEKKTFEDAKKNAYKIAGLSKERLSAELKKIIQGKNSVYAIEKLIELKIFPKSQLTLFKENKNLTTLAFDLFKGDFEKTEKFLTVYAENKKQSEEILGAIIFAQKFDREKKITSFINNEENIEKARLIVKSKEKFEMLLDEIGKNKLPLSISELNITGSDLLGYGIEPVAIGKELQRLLILCVEGKVKNKKEDLAKRLMEE